MFVEEIKGSSTELFKEVSAFLNDEELEKYQSFSNESRKREWLFVRQLLKQNLGNKYSPIFYSATGKPNILGYNISISHSKNWVAILLSKDKKVAIDIQLISPSIKRIASKFISQEEKNGLKAASEEVFTTIWSAKEVLFKLHEIGQLDFKSQLKYFHLKWGYLGSY